MNKILLSILLILPFQVFGLEIKVGDIFLQPRQCWSCSLIEEQEETIYSHIGMVIQLSPLKVIDALGTVRISEFEVFNSGTEKGQKISVRRFRDHHLVTHLQENKEDFFNYFQEQFAGLKYDHDFLWNNKDENGHELLYCSEMISKLLSGFLNVELPLKRMNFDKNPDEWGKYFRRSPPQGEWGNSPADYERSNLFYEVGEL